MDQEGQRQLLDASDRGDAVKVAHLLSSGANVNSHEAGYHRTPLHVSSWRGREAVVKLLLDEGADVDPLDWYDRTPLHDASSKGHCNVVHRLTAAGADVNAIDSNQRRTPLHFACANGHKNVVLRLMQAGADVNVADDEDGTTALDLALSREQLETALCLLVANADLVKSKKNSTPSASKLAKQVARNQKEEDDLFEMIARLQGECRLDNQRSPAPAMHSPSSNSHPAAPRLSLSSTTYTQDVPIASTPEAETSARPSTSDDNVYETPVASSRASASASFGPLAMAPPVKDEVEDHTYETPDVRSPAKRESMPLPRPPAEAEHLRRSQSERVQNRAPPITPHRPSISGRSSASAASARVLKLTLGTLPEVSSSDSISHEEATLKQFEWYVGETDRKEAEELLKHWPTGTFVVRKGRSSRVITLKFPVAKDKIFFHVRVTLEDMMYRVAESESFDSIPELIEFYVKNPHRFFRGMAPEERTKHQLLPFQLLPKLDIADNSSQEPEVSEA